MTEPAHCADCADEDRLARNIALRISEEWPLRPTNDVLTNEVTRISHRLAEHTGEHTNVNWRYRIVRNFAPYAYAIGGGRIYISDGMIRFVKNEAELAAALAHEMGHQIAGHFCEKAPGGTSTRTWLAGLFSALRDQPTHRHAVGVATLVMEPRKELEADAIGAEILVASGYNPRAILSLVRRLPTNAGSSSEPNQARIAALEQRLNQLRADDVPEMPSEHFLSVQQSLQLERW